MEYLDILEIQLGVLPYVEPIVLCDQVGETGQRALESQLVHRYSVLARVPGPNGCFVALSRQINIRLGLILFVVSGCFARVWSVYGQVAIVLISLQLLVEHALSSHPQPFLMQNHKMVLLEIIILLQVLKLPDAAEIVVRPKVDVRLNRVMRILTLPLEKVRLDG